MYTYYLLLGIRYDYLNQENDHQRQENSFFFSLSKT